MKRIFDIILSALLLILFSPLLFFVSILIFLNDYYSPFYVANRVGKKEKLFKMIKFRTMIVDAENTGVFSTKSGDNRITKIGAVIRKYKLDELPQLYNVLIGQMSFVGPRPNVLVETNLYSKKEKEILQIRPGITDFSSIIFSNEGEVLEEFEDPDLAYNQFIRPWKSRLALFYKSNQTLFLDLKLIIITVISLFNREMAVKLIVKILRSSNEVEEILLKICSGEVKLKPYPPPGLKKIVNKRN